LYLRGLFLRRGWGRGREGKRRESEGEGKRKGKCGEEKGGKGRGHPPNILARTAPGSAHERSYCMLGLVSKGWVTVCGRVYHLGI